jgi:hypothetical protein
MLELLNTTFAGLTLAVIAVSAVVALIQLRHLRASYQMSDSAALLQAYWTPQFQQWFNFALFRLPERLNDPAFRAELRAWPIDKTKHPEVYVCEYYTLIGSYMKNGLMPRRIFLEIGSRDALIFWSRLRPAIELMREGTSTSLYADFEYLAVLCQRWISKHDPR